MLAVRELELDLDAFEGPFDLLLSLVLREELPLREVDLAEIIIAFIENLSERGELDLDACGEFLILISALLELKARAMFPDEEAELAELEPEEAAEELARRLAEYRRAKEAANWLRERLDERRDLFFRTGPAPLAPKPERKLAQQDPEKLVAALRGLAVEPPTPSTAHMALRFPPVTQFLDRWRSLLRRRSRFDFDQEVAGPLAGRGRRRLPGAARAAQAGRDRDRPVRAVRPDKDFPCRCRKESLVDSPLRLITTEVTPAAELARTVEALLVVASQPLPLEELAAATEVDAAAVEQALELLGEKFSEETSGIVLEHVAGRLRVPRLRRRVRGLRAPLREAGREGPLAGGARDARDRRLPRAGHPPRGRAHPRRQRRRRDRRPRRARADRRRRPRERVRCDPLPHDAALRAHLRPRLARRAAARRRPRRRRDRDPRAPRSGRREAPRVARTSVPGTGVPGTGSSIATPA